MFGMQIVCIPHAFLFVARVDESLLAAGMIALARDRALDDNIGSFKELVRGDVRAWMWQGGIAI